MRPASINDRPRKRLRWTPFALAVAVTLLFGGLVFPRIGLPLPAVFLLLTAWCAVLIWANLRALSGMQPTTRCLPTWRVTGGLCAAVAMALLAVLAVLDGPLQERVRATNDMTADHRLAALPDGPPAYLVDRADELDTFLQLPVEEDPDLSRLVVDLDGVRLRISEVEAKMPCELDGNCGSLRAGAREVYQGLVDLRTTLLAREQQLSGQVAARRTTVDGQRAAARAELASVTAELDEHRSRLQDAEDAIEAGRADTGTVRRFVELGSPALLGDPGVQTVALVAWIAALGLYALADTGGLALLLRYFRIP